MFRNLCKTSLNRRVLPQTNVTRQLSSLANATLQFKTHKTDFTTQKLSFSTATNRFLQKAPERVFPKEDMSAVLKAAKADGLLSSNDAFRAPVAFFYDLDLLDWQITDLKEAFGPTFHHHFAIKSNSVTSMLQYLYKKHDLGLECCSLGEVMQAIHCQLPHTHIVYDSPCKTQAELEYILKKKIYTNLDNYDDLARAADIIQKNNLQKEDLGVLGIRINPLVGAGEISALSVSTSDSKFGVPISELEKLLQLYQQHEWMNSVHVHVGSGGMGVDVLKEGVKTAAKFAVQVNKQRPGQITNIDIGGGKPANFLSDSLSSPKVPDFRAYAEVLKTECPELFSGEYKVVTEFGQGMSSKFAFLASPVEWLKGTEEKPIPIVHFGADTCVRQVYDNNSHERRLEVYKEDGSPFSEEECKKTGYVYGEYNGSKKQAINPDPNTADMPYSYSVGGPLCFQGDFLARDIRLPSGVKPGDLLVMKDAGGSTLSCFSRHTSRLCPPVYGFRWVDGGVKFETLKPMETVESLNNFWGPLHPL